MKKWLPALIDLTEVELFSFDKNVTDDGSILLEKTQILIISKKKKKILLIQSSHCELLVQGAKLLFRVVASKNYKYDKYQSIM